VPAREIITYDRPTPAWPWRLAVFSCALAMTAFTALLVPLADLLTKAPARDLEYRTIELSEWRPPPPPAPPPPVRPVTPQKAPPRTAPRSAPRLDEPAPSQPSRLKLPVKLDLALSDFRTDLTLDFDPDPTAQAIPETAAPAPPAAPAAAAAPPPPPSPSPVPPAELSQLDRHPSVLDQTKPIYPYRARAQRLEGHVDLRFTVTAQGRVEDVEVLQAEPRYVFDDAATSAVRRWTFSPGVRDGHAVPARMQIRIRFTLEEP